MCHKSEKEKAQALGDDLELDIGVQIGKDSIQKVIQSGPNLTQRYTSIMINGFSAEQELTEIHTVLASHGLPVTVSSEDIIRNERSSKLTVENFSSADCLTLMENMHGRKFLGRKVFIIPYQTRKYLLQTQACPLLLLLSLQNYQLLHQLHLLVGHPLNSS